MGGKLFEDEQEKEKFYGFKSYEGVIVEKEGKDIEDVFDSLLPKRVGFVPEILVYAYLIRKNYGYVVPLLLAQRLLGKWSYIIPPDFLLLRSKGEIFGLEVGTGKERQIASFSSITSIPVFTVGIGTPEQPQPYRCGKCRKWIIYCDRVIEVCSKNQDNGRGYLICKKECPLYYKECPYTVYYGEAYDYSGKIRKLRYHYSCVKDDPLVKEKEFDLIAPIPFVSGLENISEE